ncbi:hypothetical protein P3W85_41945 [Cupriavidus basilensis]|uniref:Uncharacterized protein n=1 Tax=Cupriavidus basilensis TaxID=68895 RepID=A0ABT6B3K3_9BURK|nr:hypothetical protein [Cupriavidus basilensis]MDF3839455.1 hypothetical protein [Cupriavidus basilensis]
MDVGTGMACLAFASLKRRLRTAFLLRHAAAARVAIPCHEIFK